MKRLKKVLINIIEFLFITQEMALEEKEKVKRPGKNTRPIKLTAYEKTTDTLFKDVYLIYKAEIVHEYFYSHQTGILAEP